LDVEPPLLSVICRELNERRRALGQKSISADLVSGNRREILTDFYERSVADLPEGMRRFVEDRLLTKSGFRDNLALETALEEPGVTKELIDTLVFRRLLRIEDRIGTQRVELTHDVLAEVIRASRDSRQQRLAVEQAEQRERQARAEAARRTRRLRWLVAALGVAVVGLSIGAFFGIRAQALATKRASQSDIQFASQLSGEGKDSDALAYLVRAARRDPHNPVLAPRILSELVNQSFLLPEGPPIALPSPAVGPPQYSADGRSLFVQGEDGIIRVIDTSTWQVARAFDFGQKVAPNSWSLAKGNDQVIAVGLEDGSILVCDRATGKPITPPLRPKELTTKQTLRPVLSPDGRWVATSNNRYCWLWDVQTGEQRAAFSGYGTNLGIFAFSPDSRLIVTAQGSYGAQALFWSLPAGTGLGGVQARSDWPNGFGAMGALCGLTFSPDGSSLAVVYVLGGADVFEVATRMPKGAHLTPALVSGHGLTFNADGSQLIVAGDRAVHVIDWAKATRVVPVLPHGGQVYDLNLSADNKRLVTAGADGLARLWDLSSGKLLAEPTLRQTLYTPAVLTPDGSQVILFTATGPAHRLGVVSRAESLTLPSPYGVTWASFLPGSPTRVLRLLGDRAIAIDVVTGRESPGGFRYPSILGVRLNPRALLTPDRQILLVREGSGNSDVPTGRGWWVWRLDSSGKVTHRQVLEGIPQQPAISFSSGGEFLVAAGPAMPNESVGIWNLRTGAKVAEFKRDLPILADARFSPVGNRLGFRTSDNVVHVTDYSGGEIFAVRSSGRAEISVWGFSPDGSRLVTGDAAGGVQFRRADTGEVLQAVQRHHDSVSFVRFSDDGVLVVSASTDGSAQVWETARGLPVAGLLGHEGAVGAAGFSPNGRRIFTRTLRGELRFWDVVSGQPISAPLSHRAGQDLTVATPVLDQFGPDGGFFLARESNPEVFHLRSIPPDGAGAAVPSWLLRLATLCAGRRLTEEGEYVSAADEVERIDELRRELSELPPSAPFTEWGRWFLADSSIRSIAPGFTVTPAEAKTIAARMGATEPLEVLRQRSARLWQEKKWAEAEEVDRESLAMARAHEGEEGRFVSEQLIRLAQTLIQGGKFAEAEELARACLAMRPKYHNADDWQMPDTRMVIGHSLLGQGRLEEAETLLVSAYEQYRPEGGPFRKANHARFAAELYQAANLPDKAAEWNRRAAEATTQTSDAPPAVRAL
jgi:WD40 repeat protein